jgi:hypothetical protein
MQDRQQIPRGFEADRELCLKLKKALDAVYHGVKTRESKEYFHWGQLLLALSENGPLEDPPSRDELYLAAVNTLQAQALHGPGRPPLAHRVIIDPEAFFMALATAIKTVGLRF